MGTNKETNEQKVRGCAKYGSNIEAVNWKAIIIMIIATLDMFINIYNNVRTADESVALALTTGIILAICDMTILFSIIEIANKPIIGMILLITSQTFTFIYDLISGATAGEALSDMGITGLLVIIALVYHMVSIYKKETKACGNKDSKAVKEKLISIIDYERPIYKVKAYTRVIIYALVISAIMTISQSEMLTTVSSNSYFRVYSAFALMIPTFLVIGTITTSYIAYELFVSKLIIECYTVYMLLSINEFDFIQVVYIVVEVIAIIYAYYISHKMHYSSKEVINEEK